MNYYNWENLKNNRSYLSNEFSIENETRTISAAGKPKLDHATAARFQSTCKRNGNPNLSFLYFLRILSN